MAAQPVRQRIVVPFGGHVIGEGFNSDTVERVGTGLTVGRTGFDPVAPGQAAVFKFQMLTSQASLEKALSIGTELEARYALFSGGAKFSFAEQSAVNSSSTYIVASCIITNALRFGSEITPTETADRLIRAGDKDGFKRAFGDRFTQALHTGGEFHALVRVTSSKGEHQRRIAASLHGELNGLTFGGSFKASLETATRDTSAHTELNIQIHQTGGVGQQVQIPGTDADKIREHMNQFASAAQSNAAAYAAELLTYDTLALPFPSEGELEDRRRVLEDCLQRRQRYWSAISELTFAQSEDARLIFQDLPSDDQLVELQNAFRRVLNDLMAHARNVSAGVIPPAFFVAENEPVLPHLKRRNASTFAVWWAKRNDPTLLQDEVFLLSRIANGTRGLLTVPPEEASPEAMERAADTLTGLDVSFSETESFPKLRSIASLPDMIDAPLQEFRAQDTNLDELSGLHEFTRLEVVVLDRSLVRNLTPLTFAAGIGNLNFIRNNVADLEPLRALTRLQRLFLAGNQVRSLEPLRALPDLRVVSIARIDRREGILIDNPIADARALAALPLLGSPLASADRVRISLFDPQAAADPIDAGVATRIGATHRFEFTSDTTGTTEELLLMALAELSDLNVVRVPVALAGVHFRDRNLNGVASAKPNEPAAAFPAMDLAGLFANPAFTRNNGPGEEFVRSATGRAPELFLEVTPA